jgi:sugar/nucleoside kinase (ribokinase family)
MTTLKPIQGSGLRYDHIVGTGGIGSGMFFSLKGNHSLGRNESRMATLLPCKDFCKQHIIMHYISVLLGAGTGSHFQSYPIGKVGDDETGLMMKAMMEKTGMNISHVKVEPGHRTLFSVCFQYPDFSGGNITTENSASRKVSTEDIDDFFSAFTSGGQREIILAAPEVPLEARYRLLEAGRERGSFNIAALLSSEAHAFRNSGHFSDVDLLSVNIDEAEAITNVEAGAQESRELAEILVSEMIAANPAMQVILTDGKNGSFCYAQNQLVFVPPLPAAAVSTAGAGDAFLAGVIAALCCGLPLTKNSRDNSFSETPVDSAMELGTMLASLSVTSPDTIHLSANAGMLLDLSGKQKVTFSENFNKIFGVVQ